MNGAGWSTPATGLDRFLEQASATGADGLATIHLPVGAEAAPLPDVGRLLAGAAEVDITPPPGMPKSGHSRNAQDGTGFRTRLRVRVLHLRAGHTSLALVAGDMHSGSAVVHALVAGAVAARTDVRRAGLFLGATHTHAGPGQFHGSDFYNRWASNRPGLDPAYTAYLCDRISEAVVAAHDRRVPARLAFGSAEVWGFTRNRSLPAHVGNRTVADKRTGAQRRYAAINPWLHLLRVDRDGPGQMGPLAALAFFSIHGTGISRHDPAYNADVWAYLTGEMERRIEARTGVRPVCGAVEGTHGDVTPAVRPGLLVYAEAERVGSGIGEVAAELHRRLEPELTGTVRLAAAYREVDLSAGPVIAGIHLPEPAVGAAKIAGATENATPFLDRIPPFRPGFPKPGGLARSPQGRKWILGGWRLQDRLAPAAAFPRILPLQTLAVGPAVLLGLPFEITVEAGRRLEAALTPAAGAIGAGRVVVSSAANDYWDYLTTSEEYDRQCYEGASNLYGPRTLEFVSAAAADLAGRLSDHCMVDEGGSTRRFRGTVHRYLTEPEAPGAGPARRLDPAVFVEAEGWNDAYWEMRWSGGGPGALAWDAPLVRVERMGTDGSWSAAGDRTGPVDDGGWHVGVFHLGPDRTGRREPGRHRYAARWYQPPLGAPDRYRFVLEANHGHPEQVGQPFD